VGQTIVLLKLHDSSEPPINSQIRIDRSFFESCLDAS
jgi:hypothetical protein